MRPHEPSSLARRAACLLACSALALSACSPDHLIEGPVSGSGLGGDGSLVDGAEVDVLADATPDVANGTPCDDGRVCTVGDLWVDGVCVGGANICPCEPGVLPCPAASGDVVNHCRGPDQCVPQPAGSGAPFACLPNVALSKVCDASLDDACNHNACDPADGSCAILATELTTQICDLPGGGCRYERRPAGNVATTPASCDDGLVCSTDDHCKDGACVATVQACTCSSDADCVDDGDKCNGVPFCDKSGPKWACKLNPATVVACDVSTDSACAATACEPKSGACKKGPKALGVPCDDGLACTEGDVCDGAGACKPGTWTCCKTDADCPDIDQNLCNGVPFCNLASGQCEPNKATVITCPTGDDTACSAAACDKATGTCALAPTNEGIGCDDGVACTQGEVCAQGSCSGGKDLCPCKSDADCADKDDGDLCNGVLYCNLALGACKPNPATVVVCQTVGDTACSATSCTPKTGTCETKPVAAGKPCDADGIACTANDACDGKGTCKAGKSVCPCLKDSDCVDDGNLCNGTPYCDKSGATPSCKLNLSTPITCPSVDDTPCRKNTCQPKSGACLMVNLAKGSLCTDGDPCTGQDQCDAKGVCVGGAQQLCGCASDGDCAGFDDDDICNGSYACKDGACIYDGKALKCDDGDGCTLDGCHPVNGCVHASLPNCVPCASSKDCDDNNVCTTEACVGGACLYGKALDAKGKPVACDDGDACTAGEDCTSGQCAAGNPISCDDGNPCTNDGCNNDTGCTHAALSSGACNDGKACTEGDACKNGACVGGPAKGCDDGNACTTDACDDSKGCTYVAASGPCSDGDACTTGDACKSGACAPGTPQNCDDGDPCTVDGCVGVQGCTNLPNALDCDDGKVCTTDSCEKGKGCAHVFNNAQCDDGQICSGTDFCENGSCKSGNTISCDDGDACTTDSCHLVLGCQHATWAGSCNDGNPCTTGDDCSTGACQGAGTADCDDKMACTKDSCEAPGGCKHVAGDAACDDGNPCTTGGCDAAGGCAWTPKPLGTKVSCYSAPGSTPGVGTCAAGVATCDGQGKEGTCVGEVVPKELDNCGGGDEDCDGVTDENCANPIQLNPLCGDAQTGKPGAKLYQPLVVEVTNTDGTPMAGIALKWTSDVGEVTGDVVTDAAGQAQGTLKLSPISGATHTVDVTIPGNSFALVQFMATSDANLPAYHFDYVAFCDASALQPIGNAAKLANSFLLTQGKESDAGALWFKTPLVPASFSSSFVVSGFAAAWSFVLQATASQDQLSAGSVADNTTPLLTSAIVVRVEGELNQPSTLSIYAGGVKVAEQPNAFTWTQTQSVQRFWVDADYVKKTVSVYVGDTKPATALLSGTVDMGKVLSTQSQPMIVGFTAGNSAAAFGTKSLISWWGKHN